MKDEACTDSSGQEYTRRTHSQALEISLDGHLRIRDDIPDDGAEFYAERMSPSRHRALRRGTSIIVTRIGGHRYEHIYRTYLEEEIP